MRQIIALVVVLLLLPCCDKKKDYTSYSEIVDPLFSEPQFPGGTQALKRYLKNYQWRQEHLATAGTVFVEFLIREDGSVKNVSIARGLCETYDAEAVRLVKQMPNWIPAYEGGEAKDRKMIIPIKFDLTNPYE